MDRSKSTREAPGKSRVLDRLAEGICYTRPVLHHADGSDFVDDNDDFVYVDNDTEHNYDDAFVVNNV